MTGAKFEYADLTGTQLEGAILDDVNFGNVISLDDEMPARALGVSQVQLPSALSQRNIRLESRTAVIDILGDVCRGIGVDETKDYYPDQSFHPVVVLNSEGKELIVRTSNWSNSMARHGLEPMAVRFAELLECAEKPQYKVIETCNYTGGGTLKREQDQMQIRLVAARTGEIVVEATLKGALPEDCPMVKASGTQTESGAEIYAGDLIDWLAEYVNPPPR